MSSLESEKKNNIRVSAQPVEQEPSPRNTEEGRDGRAQKTSDGDDPPDGGFVAWMQVVAGHFINAIAAGFPSAFGVYQLYYTSTLGISPSHASWIGSFQTFFNFMMCFVSGRLCDAGYVKQPVYAGSFLVLLGTFVTSISSQLWILFLFQGFCTGVGLGLMYSPGATVVSSYFKKKRSLALGISTAGTATGSVVFPAAIQYLMARVGFHWAVRCAGLIVILMVAIITFTLRPREDPPTQRSDHVFEWGAFKDAPYVLYVLGTFMFYLAFYFGFFYINTYAMDVTSFTPTSAVNLLIIVNALGIPSRPIVGFIADRYLGALNTFILSLLLLAVTLYSWVFISTPEAMYGFAVVFGITSAASSTMFVSALASITEDQALGTRLGMCCFLIGIATLIGPPIASKLIIAAHGHYMPAQIWAGSVTVVGFSLLVMTKWTKTGKIFTEKI